MTELLAPAGDIHALKAAVFGGADAVYFGLQDFNARRNAKNFNHDDLAAANDLCRTFGVKMYLTLNTLCRPADMQKALDLAEKVDSTYPVDAYIVQDLGLAYALKQRLPHAELHASTQLCVHNSIGSKTLETLGFSRVVLAREMCERDIAAFCATSRLQAEVFVHGAMCVSQSGGCLMSAMIGGRSGNFGECAYPCRMPYQGKTPYPLSLKDLCLANHIPRLMEMGVDSFKIEGRMKSPEYVYTVTSVYRRLIDEQRPPNPAEMQALSDIFSRSGFTDGYFSGKKRDMFGVRRQSDKDATRNIDCEIPQKRLKIDIYGDFRLNTPSSLTVVQGDTQATVLGAEPQQATAQPLTADSLTERISKLGGTHFVVENVYVSAENGIFLPISDINALRREAIFALNQALKNKNAPMRHDFRHTIIPEPKKCQNSGIILRFEGKTADFSLAKQADRIDIPIWRNDLITGFNGYNDKICLILPRVIFDSKADEINDMLQKAKSLGITKVLVPNITFLPLCDGFEVHGDFSLNCLNETTRNLLYSLGFSTLLASPESPRVGDARIVYGRVPLMFTEACIAKNIGKCGDCAENLVDRTGAKFPVFKAFGCTSTIFNSVPTWLFDKPIDDMAHYFIFTDETAQQQRQVMAAYRDKLPPQGKFTRR